jgi:hypothetical protein
MHRLIALVYNELRAISHNRRVAEREHHTLNTTAIVHARAVAFPLHFYKADRMLSL